MKTTEFVLPVNRSERLRKTQGLRQLSRENYLHLSDLVLPLFLKNEGSTQEVSSMPGVYQWNLQDSLSFVEEQVKKGIRSLILFGIVPQEEKCAIGKQAYDENSPVMKALQLYRREFGDINLFADVCLCEYTDHGHCGPLQSLPGDQAWRDHQKSLLEIARTALAYAQAGADIVAPSAMLDGMVLAIRRALDENSYGEVACCSYAVKYASSFYGPFRDAAHSSPSFGDRRTYQMDPANRREALKEAIQDLQEGADMLLIKPASHYLDILREVTDLSKVPVGAYQVSGEYSMIKFAAAKACIDENKCFAESLISMKRAGAKFILSYWAPKAADLYREGFFEQC